jgi:Leucine-rich repeat (LRR) protein
MWLFCLSGNKLSGIIPPSLYNLSSLKYFKVEINMLHGSIPGDIGNKFPEMKELGFAENHLTGTIPSSISNLSHLTDLELSKNRFSGYVPPIFGMLGALQGLYLSDTKLEVNDSKGWEFITSLANCSQLQDLELGGYSFGGQLPASITNLSATLQQLYIADNRISGSIPADIGNLVGLNRLQITNALISGVIPESIDETGFRPAL